jgi:hypothetical protein
MPEPSNHADDPLLAELLAYWERKRADRPMPQRADLDPAEIPSLLPHLRLTEVMEGGKRFRYRLVGTAIVEAYGREHTGRHLDEVLSGERLAFVEGLYRTVCERQRPIFARTYYVGPWAVPNLARRVMVPLSDDGEMVNVIVTVLAFNPRPHDRKPIGLACAMDLARSSVQVL